MSSILLIPIAPLIFLLLFWLLRSIRDKKQISKAGKKAVHKEKENQKRNDYLKQVIYDLCRPDEYYHELLGAHTNKFSTVTEIIVRELYPSYEDIKNKHYSSVQELKHLHLTIKENLSVLRNRFSIDIAYSDIPVLYQHLNDLLDRIERESIFVLNNKRISILSEIREHQTCYCFCIEIDISEYGPVSKGKPYMIFESNIRKSVFIPLNSSEKEIELLRRFKDKSERVRIELNNIAEKQKNNQYENNKSTYASGKSYGNSSNKQKSRSYQGGNTNRNDSKTRKDNFGSSSQNERSKSNNHSPSGENKNELEMFIFNMSKSNRYYSYFMGCKTFADVKKRRNELVKQFHPDMGNSNGEEINYINPIFDELKRNFGSSK